MFAKARNCAINPKNLFEHGAIVAPEIGGGLEVRLQPSFAMCARAQRREGFLAFMSACRFD
jgi:hypothetical protein